MRKPADIFNKLKAVKILLGTVLAAVFFSFNAAAGTPCGEWVNGCPTGELCWKSETKADNVGPSYMSYHYIKCVCSKEQPRTFFGLFKDNDFIQTNEKCEDYEYRSDLGGAVEERMLQNEDGEKIKQTRNIVDTPASERKDLKNDGWENVEPHNCQVSEMREKYQSKCYSCVIVKTLIETFMTACSKVYDVSREAGIKLLFIGSLIWLVAFVIKNVSSMTNVEPATMINSLLVFFFKVMFAAIVINAGIGVIISYMINPILTAGADFGLAIMNTTADITSASNSFIVGSREAAPTIEIAQVANADGTASNIISADVMNKLVLFTENLDKTVSNNLVIGHAMTCHSMYAGAWKLTKDITIINMWLWFCGASIWFVGFMLTLGICYYLLDISFKLGFAIIALPVVIGLWPFNITQGKLKDCFSIILKSAATFMFLALTTTYATVLISQALNGTSRLLNAIESANDAANANSAAASADAEYISNIFDITGPFFIIIIIAFLYSMKLIGSTVKSYADKFFGDSVFGSESPMHHKLTQVTDFVEKKAIKAGGAALGAATGAVGKGVEKTLGKAGKFIRSKFKGSDKKKSESQNTLTTGGNATKKAGTATKQTGKAMEQTGKTVEQTGKAAEKGGKVAAKGGQGMMKGGKALCGTGIGALIGVPMILAGAAVFAAGKGVEYGGKAVKYSGKAVKKAGQATKKIGEKMEKAGEKMEKVGKKWQTGEADSDQPKDAQTK